MDILYLYAPLLLSRLYVSRMSWNVILPSNSDMPTLKYTNVRIQNAQDPLAIVLMDRARKILPPVIDQDVEDKWNYKGKNYKYMIDGHFSHFEFNLYIY